MTIETKDVYTLIKKEHSNVIRDLLTVQAIELHENMVMLSKDQFQILAFKLLDKGAEIGNDETDDKAAELKTRYILNLIE